MPMTWSHAVLYVHDLDRMLDFYTRVLGFQITDRGPIQGRGVDIVFLSQDPGEHHQIGMLPMRDGVAASNSVAHLAFRVESLGELKTMIESLKGEGIEMRRTSHGNTWSIYCEDIECNGLEIFCDTPWHVSQPQGETWDETMDEADLLAWTEATFKDQSGFEPKADYHKRLAETLN